VRQLREQKVLNDTVYIHVLPGNYFMKEPLVLTSLDGGTPQAPVVFSGDTSNRPVFYGGMKLSRFEEVNANLWCVFIPEVAQYGFNFEQLYINGERRFRAQTPNHGNFYMVKDVEEIPFDQTTGQTARFASQKIKLNVSEIHIPDDLKAGEQDNILAVFHQKWSETRQFIKHINKADSSVYITGRGMVSWIPIDKKSRYYIENYFGALDSPGEWFLSRDGYLYYIPLEGETINSTECIAPVMDKFIVISGDESTGEKIEHIHFKNLSFRVSGYKTPVRGNSTGQAASSINATIMVDFAKNIEFSNCEINHTGQYAIWFRRACSESSVKHCHLHDLGAGGIKIGETGIRPDSTELTKYITVDNNIIQHGGYVFPDAVGVIIFQGSDNTVTHNDIADFRYSGVSVGWVWGYSFSPSKRNKIEFNHIHHLGWGELCDMGGVYTLGQSEGTTVSNNVVHHVYSFDYGGWGLYNDEGSSGIVLENNLVYNCKNAGFNHHYGKENIIRNNIFAFNILGQVQFNRPEEHKSFSFTNNIIYYRQGEIFVNNWGKEKWLKSNTEVNFNCYWNPLEPDPSFHLGMNFQAWQKHGKDRNSLIADPLFRDPDNLDFQFKSLKTVRKIGFKPFDYTKAGVYGDESWKKLAELDPSLEEKFDKAVVKNRWTGE
jgi:parallel beta-helix repeat protein